MRVLLVSDDPNDPQVGAAKVPRKLQAALRRLGHDCDIIFRGDLAPWPRRERLRYAVSPWLAWRGVARAWRARGPYDVIDAAGAEGWVVGLARRWGAFPGAALVARSHGLDHIYYRGLVGDHHAGMLRKPLWRRWWYPLVRLNQVALAFRLADRAIMLNSLGRGLALRRGWKPAERIDVIPHGVDAHRWAAAPAPAAPRGAGVLFSGTWYTGKGVGYLAEAHRLLLARGVRIPLTLLGGGIDDPFPELERYVRSSFAPACQPLLTVRPRISDEDAVFAYYRSHDFLVCPSTAEGFGLVVIEALSQRLPVICTSTVGASERLRHGLDALITPPRDAPALADAIEQLWCDRKLRLELAEAGYQRAREWSWEHAAEQTLCSYQAARRDRSGSDRL